jgi:putative ABC transport system permease protein
MIVGAHAVLLFGGYSRNITYGLQTDFVKTGGHLQVQRAGYFATARATPPATASGTTSASWRPIRHDPS